MPRGTEASRLLDLLFIMQYRIPRQADARKDNAMSKLINWISIALLCSVTMFIASDRIAIGQAGSTGGTIGKTDKSVSGGEEQKEPRTAIKRRVHTVVAGRIKVTSATLGQNCGAPVGNVTEKVGTICNGQQTCELSGSRVNDPDPARGCYKTFAVKWQCGQSSRTRSNSVPASPNETNALTLSCN
jgi:hypothetical protein